MSFSRVSDFLEEEQQDAPLHCYVSPIAPSDLSGLPLFTPTNGGSDGGADSDPKLQ